MTDSTTIDFPTKEATPIARLLSAYGQALLAQRANPTVEGQVALNATVGAIYAHVDAIERQHDELKYKAAHPTVAGVLHLVELCEQRWRAAEAAHEAKDEANRRWLAAEMAAQQPVVLPDVLTERLGAPDAA